MIWNNSLLESIKGTLQIIVLQFVHQSENTLAVKYNTINKQGTLLFVRCCRSRHCSEPFTFWEGGSKLEGETEDSI